MPDLVAAFEHVLRRHPAARLLIAGDGPQRQAIQDDISARGLDHAVRLLGFRRDVAALLSAADLFVSASVSEGSPVAVLEAMAHGLPVVATSVGDVPAVVSPAGGLVVPAGSPVSLATAISDALDAPDAMRAIGEAAAVYVAEHHSARHWADVVVDVYRDLASVRTSAPSTLRAGR
jgi:glycosyltransferase involved in cell wall biosynthesis